MQVSETTLPGVLLVEPDVYGDDRGFFLETFQTERYAALGIEDPFVQDNLSYSQRGILRGLHFQEPNAQGKLVYVLQGEVFDVAVDIRVGSPHFGQSVAVHLTGESKRQLWIPPGFAHGFCVLSPSALFAYKCTDFYNPKTEASIRWDDPQLGIDWPLSDVQLSVKDAQADTLGAFPESRLPRYSV